MRRRYLVLASLCLVVLFRGPLFRALFSYRIIGSRPVAEIEASDFSRTDGSVVKYGAAVQRYTADRLVFTTGKASKEPNQVLLDGKANCIGYASVASALAARDDFAAEHLVAKIYFLGFDIHPLFNDPFFADHDIVRIKDGASDSFVFDPSLYDYFRIGRVRIGEE